MRSARSIFGPACFPTGDAALLRSQLRKYLDLRISFYQARTRSELRRINADTAQLASGNVAFGGDAALEQQTAAKPLGFGHERRAEFARIHSGGMVEPHPVPRHGVCWHSSRSVATCWSAMVRMAPVSRAGLLFVLPLIVSTSFLLIADIDCPHTALFTSPLENLISLSASLPSQ